MNKLIISPYKIVGSSYYVASSDGDKVFTEIVNALNHNKEIVISFKEAKTVTSAFLNSAVGKLFGKFDEEKINKYVNYTDISPSDLELLGRVQKFAKFYYSSGQTSQINALVSRELEHYV